MKVGDKLVCINIQPLKGNSIAPRLSMDREYEIKEIIYDSKNNPHFDVGIPSSVSSITSWDTGEVLPRGEYVHWCHPSRFKTV